MDEMMVPLSPRSLEALNGVLMVMYIGMLFCFGTALIKISRDTETWADWYARAQGQLALVIFFVGGLMIRGPIWMTRFLLNDGIEPGQAWRWLAAVVVAFGMVAQVVGANCIMRVFSPQVYRFWPAVGLSLIAVLLGVMAAF